MSDPTTYERIDSPSEFASDLEMDEAASPDTGTGPPETAPHEPVRLTLWERLSGRFPTIEEENDS